MLMLLAPLSLSLSLIQSCRHCVAAVELSEWLSLLWWWRRAPSIDRFHCFHCLFCRLSMALFCQQVRLDVLTIGAKQRGSGTGTLKAARRLPCSTSILPFFFGLPLSFILSGAFALRQVVPARRKTLWRSVEGEQRALAFAAAGSWPSLSPHSLLLYFPLNLVKDGHSSSSTTITVLPAVLITIGVILLVIIVIICLC